MSTESKKEYARKRRELDKEISRTKLEAGLRFMTGRVSQETLEARLAEIPEDTRDLTARLMGDPLPGRRAIDRREASQ